ncbi:asparagine synthetase B family protein [Natrialba asiatica]|uniref:asparagine synthetase B family protein n=1 Tax=Natrialba asiatica TaxID=64602 RepID=UPI0013757363|nr:asparagine synthetase B family protein [Natrialba asiatica]
MVEEQSDVEGINAIIKNIDGFFALVTEIDKGTVLVTDRVSSIPLYYTTTNGILFSDDLSWIRNYVSSDHDSVSESEFRTLGYVSGPDTRLTDLSQVQAGQTVVLQSGNVNRHRHFDFEYKGSEKRTHDELDSLLTTIFKRIAAQAAGRPIWIPLSGGLDSRLILLKLIEVGYENIHTYTYGNPGNHNSTVSKDVAESVDVPWHFVEYTHDMWRLFYQKDARKEFDETLDLVTVPPTREFPALKKLKEKGVLVDDSIIIPGYSADFLAGSHLIPDLATSQSVTRETVVDAVLDVHYRYNELPEEHTPEIRRRIQSIIDYPDAATGKTAMEVYERWDWQERQVKHINNHIRYHEFLDLDWRMPFWEQSFFEFWLQTPLQQRLGKEFYDSYVQSKYDELCDEPVKRTEYADLSTIEKVKRKISGSAVGPYLRPAYRSVFDTPEKGWEDNVLSQNGMVGRETFCENYTGDSDLRGYRALERLGELSFETSEQ